jgi:tRNA(Ile)-lysidine synthase TilS/MesJ
MGEEVKLSKKLLNIIGRTNAKYSLMNEGDRVMLALSGGKDSLALAHYLNHRKRVVPFRFDFLAVTIDYGDGTDFSRLISHTKEHNIPHIIHKTNIYETAKESIRENSSYCSYFSRMRRGALYSVAKEMGFEKLALGHHLDDAVESFFMNFLYNGALRSMPPIYRADNGLLVIRPMIHVRERQLIDFANRCNLPTIGDEACPGFRFEVKSPYARAKVKSLLHRLEEENRDLFVSLKAAFENLHESTFFDNERLKR